MKKALVFLVIILAFFGCSKESPKTPQPKVKDINGDRVEVLYFFGKNRCISCMNIERYTKEVLDENFSKEIKEGKIVYKMIDYTLTENERIAEKYEVAWSSLLINKWQNGVETINDMTAFSFDHTNTNEETFKKVITEKIKSLL